ncbi:glycosyltransferase [Pengzhenrongella sicca]|uniref:Glycosyltransferase n=1 Tax=Pengzhenrongella sicca TaxID=2819238 RepID=A0A8A4ZBV0_9MICO|nr:glycosyltransferase [Pengzhenrongella sicca]QTE28901.1 glycosyltransferase [Pengzhenrongella sicca]
MRVLQVLDPPDGTTRYVDQIVHDLPADITLEYFTWRRALAGGYDVLHVHWPERLTRPTARWKRPIVRAALCVLLLRLRLTRTAIVRTEHNVDPHETGDPVERLLLGWLDRWTTLAIQLNPTTRVDPSRRNVRIPLGHYRDRFARYDRPAAVPGRLLYVGLIRPYKGVDRLLECLAEVADPDLTLRVVGRPLSPYWSELVTAATAADARISARLEFVDDETLVAEVSEAALVVLPYRELHNSATLLVALSLDRPVLVPRTPSTLALAAEVGPDWVLLYDGELTPESLTAAFHQVGDSARPAPPDLADRDWSRIGAQHAAAYRSAIDATKNHPLPPARGPRSPR